MTRDPKLQRLIDVAEQAIRLRATGPAAAAADRVFSRLAERTGELLSPPPERLSPCAAFGAIEARMSAAAAPLPELAAAFFALEPSLLWARRKGASPGNQPFYDGHANTTLVGTGGIEQRDDVWIGASAMVPGLTYPVHSHPPEEIYLAFTPGEWWNSGMDWTEPGPGGLIYNPHGIKHAMRAGKGPLLALWLLPT